MQNEDATRVLTIEDPAWGLDNLSISPALEFQRLGTAPWVVFQLINVMKDSLNEAASSLWIVQCNVISDGVKITERRLGPDYFSHRAMRCLACA